MGGNSKMKFNINNVYQHPAVEDIDLITIAQSMTINEFNEFLICYEKGLKQVMNDPFSGI